MAPISARSTRWRVPATAQTHATLIEVVATAADGRQAIDRALAHRPDVAVVDLQMPVVDGIGVVGELAGCFPRARA